jgi:hypothetical protein
MDKQEKELSKILNENHKQMMAILYGLSDTDQPTLTKFKPKKIIFNPPTTIVYWWDGTKTVVKCSEDEEFVEEVGFAMAVVKRLYGDRSKFLKFVEKAYRQPKNEKSLPKCDVTKINEKEIS